MEVLLKIIGRPIAKIGEKITIEDLINKKRFKLFLCSFPN